MNLRTWLFEEGISAAQFAPKVPTTPPTLSRYIRGVTPPPIDFVERVYVITGKKVTPYDWFSKEMPGDFRGQ